MIVFGTRDVDEDADGVPTVDLSDHTPLELVDGEILQCIYEYPFEGFENRVPPALHPTHPPLAVISFYRISSSPVGPCHIAQIRVSGLAGISRFTYPVHGWIDNPAAGELFGRRWGYQLEPAVIFLHRHHDRIWGTVTVDGRVILESGLYDPEPVNGVDAPNAGHLNLAHVDLDGSEVLSLVQAGPQLSFQRCDRGRPNLETFDSSAVRGDRPYWNVSGYAGTCAFLFNPVEFLCDPKRPALEGGFTLAGGLRTV
jgi:hypothetical protein